MKTSSYAFFLVFLLTCVGCNNIFENQEEEKANPITDFVELVDVQLEKNIGEEVVLEENVIQDLFEETEEVESIYIEECNLPTPNFCASTCCSNNHDCECQAQGGFCKPKGAEMCDCETKIWCVQKCIEDKSCQSLGKTCKPWGAEDCPEAPDCFCKPNNVCTHSQPPCCPSDAEIPCGDYCCPEDNDPTTNEECLPEIKDCLGSGEEYCPQWKIKCPIGKKCMKKQADCLDNQFYECDNDDAICSITQVCVGLGKGINGLGCCENDKPVACGQKCCDGGATCANEDGIDYCVPIGYFYCSKGVLCDSEKQKCWKGICIPKDANDCGDWWCTSTEVCAGSILKCCPGSLPQSCTGGNGQKCCSKDDKCYAGTCVPPGSEWCPKALPSKYCTPGWACEEYLQGPCCCDDACMPGGGKCCYKIGFGHYCNADKKCCGSGCIFSAQDCCAPSSGTHCPIGYMCSLMGTGCLPNGYAECDPPDPGYCSSTSGQYPKCVHKVVSGQVKNYCCPWNSLSNCIEAPDMVPYIYTPPQGPQTQTKILLE